MYIVNYIMNNNATEHLPDFVVAYVSAGGRDSLARVSPLDWSTAKIPKLPLLIIALQRPV